MLTKPEHMLETFTKYHPRLKFTYEVKNNNSLNFLNVSVIRDGQNLTSNWYRKHTFSGKYINYFSVYPNVCKINTIKNLVD